MWQYDNIKVKNGRRVFNVNTSSKWVITYKGWCKLMLGEELFTPDTGYEELFEKYKLLPQKAHIDFRIMVFMILHWENVKGIIFKDTYLSKLKDKVQEVMLKLDFMGG